MEKYMFPLLEYFMSHLLFSPSSRHFGGIGARKQNKTFAVSPALSGTNGRGDRMEQSALSVLPGVSSTAVTS